MLEKPTLNPRGRTPPSANHTRCPAGTMVQATAFGRPAMLVKTHAIAVASEATLSARNRPATLARLLRTGGMPP